MKFLKFPKLYALEPRQSRKTLNVFFSKQCSQNRWNLYLQKLLSDSTETLFILKNILLARGQISKI